MSKRKHKKTKNTTNVVKNMEKNVMVTKESNIDVDTENKDESLEENTSHDSNMHPIAKQIEPEEVEEVVKLERLQLRFFGDDIDILYRPNHSYLKFVKKDETGINLIKSYLSMSRDDFKKVLKDAKLPMFTHTIRNQIAFSKDEEWWNGAWSHQTKELLEELGLTNVIEEPIYSDEM